MPKAVEFLAREIARKAGYDPDQLVIDIDPEKDFDYISIGVAPVDIKKIKPMYTRFYKEAEKQLSSRTEFSWASL